MKRYLLLMLSLLPISISLSAQNFVENSSFELYNSLPIAQSQSEKLLNWHSRSFTDYAPGNVTYFNHSPDFYSDITSFKNFRADPNNTYSGAHFGKNYIGMTPYEIIYQGVPNFEANHLYYFSAYIQTSDYIGNDFEPNFFNGGAFTLNVKVATNEFEYQCEPPAGSGLFGCGNTANARCNSDYCTLKQSYATSTNIKNVLSYPITIQSYPIGSGWHKIEGAFIAPPDFGVLGSKYNWVGFELSKDNYSGQNAGSSDCQNACILMDDVFIGPICSNECVNKLNPITFGYTGGPVGQQPTWHPNAIQDAMVALDGAHDFKLYIKDAMVFVFDVWNGWGQHIYNYTSFDVNGLKNPTYNDFLFEWLGFLSNGAVWSADEVFIIKIQMNNCFSSLNITKSLVYLSNGSPTIPAQWTPTISNSNIIQCCPINATIDNVIYQKDADIKVQDFIHAGNFSNVSIASGLNVSYHAGNEIELGPYFQANGNFEAEIVPCGFKPLPLSSRIDSVANIKLDRIIDDKEAGIMIFPNPTSGEFFLTVPNNNNNAPYDVEICNAIGKIVMSQKKNIKSANSFDLSKYSKGLYFVRVILSEKVIISKIVLN